MDPDRLARRLRPAQRAALIAHLFGNELSLAPRPRNGTRQQRYQARRGYSPRSRLQQSAEALAAVGLLRIRGKTSRLTTDGRAVLTALFALFAETARFSGVQ